MEGEGGSPGDSIRGTVLRWLAAQIFPSVFIIFRTQIKASKAVTATRGMTHGTMACAWLSSYEKYRQVVTKTL